MTTRASRRAAVCLLAAALLASSALGEGGLSEEAGETCERDDATAIEDERMADFVTEIDENYEQEYIVMFRDYKHLSEHKDAVVSHMDQLEGTNKSQWVWVDRDNKATKYPTDFGLIRVSAGMEETVKSTLASLDGVKSITANHRFDRRALLAYEQKVDEEEVRRTRRLMAEEEEQGINFAKGPGRLHTRFSWPSGPDGAPLVQDQHAANASLAGTMEELQRHRSLAGTRALEGQSFTKMSSANVLWRQGHKGKGIRVGIFDTGVHADQPNLKHIKERSNWTYEDTDDDNLGHGTFVSGCIASTNSACPGFAPEAEIYTFKVFTNDQDSFTAWYLDAINYAIILKMHLVNVSIGGPDWQDYPFVSKFKELTGSGICMFTAIGNDGAIGATNNPGDEIDAFGVGAVDWSDRIVSFQAKGPTNQEHRLGGFGRPKPDLVYYGSSLSNLAPMKGCTSMSGTSVASPALAGLATLLISSEPLERVDKIINPGSLKQILIEGADRIETPYWNGRIYPIFHQGAGRPNLVRSQGILRNYEPRASAFPSHYDLTDSYFWPYSEMPLYATAMPTILNMTIVNGMASTGRLAADPVWVPTNEHGAMLEMKFTYSEVIWPYAGYIGVFISVKEEHSAAKGQAEGEIRFTVVSPPHPGTTVEQFSSVAVPLKALVIPTPPREKRILWDTFHNIQYPSAFIPRDWRKDSEQLDWHGDQFYTNFLGMFEEMLEAGYHLEILNSPMTCFEADNYGTLLIADPEDEYFPEEVDKLYQDITQKGLGMVVLHDWYDTDAMQNSKFYDENTRRFWFPLVGGGNSPAINKMLKKFGAAYGNTVVESDFLQAEGLHPVALADSNVLIRMPAGSKIFRTSAGYIALGLINAGKGRVVLFTDSSPWDINQSTQKSPGLITDFLYYAKGGPEPEWVRKMEAQPRPVVEPPDLRFEEEYDPMLLEGHSRVVNREIKCLMCTLAGFHGQEVPTASPSHIPEVKVKPSFHEPKVQVPVAAQTPIQKPAVTAGQFSGFQERKPEYHYQHDSYHGNVGLPQHTQSSMITAYLRQQMTTFAIVLVLVVCLVLWRRGSPRSRIRTPRHQRLRQVY